MSALNMLSEQTPFTTSGLPGPDATVNGGPSPYMTTNGFPADFLSLGYPEEDENIWNLGAAVSPGLAQWATSSTRGQAFGNPPMERDLKNTHVRNGQPTPPPFDDKKTTTELYGLSGCQFEDPAAVVDPQHPHPGTYTEHFGVESSTAGAPPAKRRKSGRNAHETEEQREEQKKRERCLERNRLAASKCRQKKKEHTIHLEERYKEQANKRVDLSGQIEGLRGQLLKLKNELLKHAQCGDEPIDMHLAQMVKKFTYKGPVLDAPPVGDVGSPGDSPAAPTPLEGADVSFGFDDQVPGSLGHQEVEQQDCQSSGTSEGSLPSFTAGETFEDFINA